MSASRHTYGVFATGLRITDWAGKNFDMEKTLIIDDSTESKLAVYGNRKHAERFCASMVLSFGPHYEVIKLR